LEGVPRLTQTESNIHRLPGPQGWGDRKKEKRRARPGQKSPETGAEPLPEPGPEGPGLDVKA
jgi:hypothetical protein